MKWCFIVFFVYIGTFLFRDAHLPTDLCAVVTRHFAPTNLIVHCEGISVGFRHGIVVRGLRIHDRTYRDAFEPLAEIESLEVRPLRHRLTVTGARYPRLPDSYYAPGNTERQARVEATLPDLGSWHVTLVRPDILSVRPALVEAEVEVSPKRVSFRDIGLTWREACCPTGLVGFCTVDLDEQRIHGETRGFALQSQIRPLIVALDVPVALPYMDAFTEVPSPVDALCQWNVNLFNNDFDLWLDLHPEMGRYAGVPFTHADGKIHVHSYTRGTWLNYRTVVGPVIARGEGNRLLEGTVTVTGTNGFNTVSVSAGSTLPLGEVLRVGGFEGEYIPKDVVGRTKAGLEFRFPRAMTNNYEVLDGSGRVEVSNGRLLRLPLFAGLTAQLADKVPGVSYLVDQSQATGEYVISNGVVRISKLTIDGGVFSIWMRGTFDSVKDELDFLVHVQFLREESLMGKYFLRPVTWPFLKLLLEFRLQGSAENPRWKYVSVIDRIRDAFR